ncbi:hypothetical protein L1892_18285 [Gordonia sp. GW1C4-4]|uniref:DUF6891 domain-containing protein n=2 Tax=Gordonia tangerina TaxID=2911060 RepID=A0ABS9DM63_9ACTN|nr:hypothetical protein [Gordonia tangerina]MCF3940325.1 hypothetical protein [Gordonia tangerina]
MMRGERLTDLRQLIRSRLAPGFTDLDEVESDARDWAEDNGASADEVTAEVRRMWVARRAEEAAWNDTGDFGRLSAAFAELDAAGVLARMNFACCARCATALIDAERTPAPERDDWYKFREWAYVFFAEADAGHIADDDPVLSLSYSGFRPHESVSESVLDAMSDGDTDAEHLAYEQTETMLAEQIVAVLRSHDLEVIWSGGHHDRIDVRIGAWRKPLPGAPE